MNGPVNFIEKNNKKTYKTVNGNRFGFVYF